MPALLCSETITDSTSVTTTSLASIIKKRQQLQLRNTDIFDLSEICDLIAIHFDRKTLAAAVRVSSQWYATWIRHLWRRVRIESGIANTSNLLQVFPRLSRHIRQLEWIHLTESSVPTSSILRPVDFSALNLHSLLLSSWTNGLDAATLSRLVESSAHRLRVLQLHNMSSARGDLLKVAGSLRKLRHFSLTMTEQDSGHNHSRQRSTASTTSIASTSSALLTLASPSSPNSAQDGVTDGAELLECTSTDSLPALMDACPELRTIELLDLRSDPATTDAATGSAADTENKEPILKKLWMPMPHLTTINLHATTISGSILSVLFARSPQLIKLNLGQNSPLYLSGFHIDPLLSMGSLSTLLLSHCHFLDGHGFKEIFKASPHLSTLDIPQTNVDDAALGVLGHQCIQLADLNLDGCQQITDQGIRDMLSHRPTPNTSDNQSKTLTTSNAHQGAYRNYNLHCLSVSNCTELTGQGVHHILMTCAQLRSLEVQQPELMPESLFPRTLESDQDMENPSAAPLEDQANEHSTIYPEAESETSNNETETVPSSLSWACHSTLELLRIKNLNFINPEQTRFLNERLRELSQLKVLHIGGSQLELSVLNGLGHQLENLYIDDLAREVDLDDVRWLVDHTPNLTRLWCRQLIRHSEPWKLLRGARKHLKLW
ncbi:hypothetical protein EDD21DRAFT_402641 [Dissophora ornata]|nr:hypothetical protein BGZ58_010387 [Dissophora ornata]KAI8603704.1 hypothetical protein EDD21DRAFT_402641 [Dissophora ornata]